MDTLDTDNQAVHSPTMSAADNQFDVVVIGAGCIGMFVAHNAIKNGLSTAVVEAAADVSSGTTAANSGIVHTGLNTAEGTLKAKYVDIGGKMLKEIS